MAQRRLTDLGFYSKAAEKAAALPQGSFPAQQLIAQLINKGGVSAAELHHAGVTDETGKKVHPDWAQRGKITRDDLVEHFHGALPQLQTKTLGGITPVPKKVLETEAQIRALYQPELDRLTAIDMSATHPLPEREAAYHAREDLLDKMFAHIERAIPNYEQTLRAARGADNPPKFASYTLPGGENYREVLLHLQDHEDAIRKQIKAARQRKDAAVSAYGKLPNGHPDTNAILKEILDSTKHLNGFRGRLGEVSGQSFRSGHWDQPNVAAHLRLKDRVGPNGEKILHVEEIQSDWGQAARKGDRVPTGPYIGDTSGWTDLALKHALGEAVKGGYDKVVWTPGEDHAKRFNLSKQVRQIAYDPEDKVLSYVTKDGSRQEDHFAQPHELPSYVGHELTQKLLATPPNELSGNHVLEGDDLSVGGRGMISYYDQIVPRRMQALARKYDPQARVEPHAVPVEDQAKPMLGVSITPQMRAAVQQGQEAFADGGAVDPDEQQALTAYHGSPHDFDAFDISKIGTGEGVQAFGHGLYFAQNEGVAKGYRDKLSAGTYKTDDGELFKPQDRDTGLQHLNVRVAAGKSLDSAADRAFGLLQDPGQSQNKDMLTQDLDRIMSMQERGAKPHAGHMYEVHIDAHPEHHMLDWDAPLSKQPKAVQDLIEGIRVLSSRPSKGDVLGSDLLGEIAGYRWVAAGKPAKAPDKRFIAEATEELKAAGLRGIRYFDRGSRGSGEGTHNYVVFDDKHVKIRRKYEHGGRISRATGGAVETETELSAEEKLAAEQKKLDDTKKADEARLQQENLARMYANPQGGSDSGPMGSPLGGVSRETTGFPGAYGLDTATMPGNAAPVGGYAPATGGYTSSGGVSSPGSRSIGASAPATTPNTFGAIPQSAYDLQNSPYGALPQNAFSPPSPYGDLPQNAFAPQSPFGALSNPFGMQAQASTPLSTRSVPSVAVQPGLPEVAMGAPVASTVFGDIPQSAKDLQNSPYGALSNPGFPSQATSPYGALSNAFDVGPMDFGMGKSLAGTPPQADMMGMSGVTPSNPYGGLSGFSPGSRSNPNPGGIDLSPNTTGQPSAFSGQIGQSVGPSTNAFSGARSSASPDLSPDTIGQPGSFSGQIGQSIGPATGSFSKDVAAPGFSDPLTGFSPEGFSANFGPPGTAGIASGYGAFAKGMADLGKETPPTRDELGATAAVPAGAPTPGSAFGDKTSNPGRNYGSPVSSREVLNPVNGVVPPSQSITTQTPESLPGNISPSYANPLGGIMDQMGGAFASPMSMSSISDINADPVSGMGAFGGVSDQMGSPAGPGGMGGMGGYGGSGSADQSGPGGPGGMGGVGGYGGDGSADQSGPGGPSGMGGMGGYGGPGSADQSGPGGPGGMGGFGGYGGDGSSDQSGPGGPGGMGGAGGKGGPDSDPTGGMGGTGGPEGGPADNGGDNDAGGAAAGPSDPGGPAGDGDGPGGGEAMAKRGGRIKTKRKKIAYSTRAASNPVVMRALMLTSRKA